MKKSLAIFLLVSSSIASSAQEDAKEQYIHRGLFRAMGSIAEGAFLKQGFTTISLTGNLEYYISDNISLRGDGNYFIGTLGNEVSFDKYYSVFSGADYHFKTKSHFDPYLGLAPGVAFAQLTYFQPFFCDPGPCLPSEHDQGAVDPLVSSVAGFNLYFQKAFHLFLETRYIYGRHLSNQAPQSLSELRFTFGLGFNLNFIKKK